ncbi:MAG TPA: lactonase family protein [Puia sp.]|jgi:6-phosphogluconolactonase
MMHTVVTKALIFFLVIGSYTKPGEKGLSVYTFDTQTGTLQFRSATGDIANPSYLTIGRNGKWVYAISERNNGSVYAYQFDQTSGTLNLVNQAPSGGKGPCYISIDDAGTHLFTANYGSGSLGVIGLQQDGSLDSTALQSIQHTGSSINKTDQTRPHAHSAVLSPDNRYVLSANLGNDHVYIYRFDPGAAEPLSPANPAYVTVTPGSGPRHICFHPNGRSVYVLNEISGSIDGYDYKDGVLAHKQTITLLPDGFNGKVEAADIHISPDGKFLYASNREDRDELVIYSIAANGTLRFAGRQPVMGVAPRGFAIDPTGKFLLVANLKTNEVLVFRRNARTGLLTFTGNKISVPGPACLKFTGPL